MDNLLNKVWVRHMLIVIGILVLWQLLVFGLRIKADNDSAYILQPRLRNSLLIEKGITRYSSLDKVSLEKLHNLSNIVENKKEEKKRMFLELYRYHFASSTMLLLLSSLSVIIVFLVAQKGLTSANFYLKTVFYVLAALTSFYAISPLVYKQESNISKNLNSYILFDNLQEEIYNYALTKCCITTKDKLDIDSFHSKVIDNIVKINSIDFEFDNNVIPKIDFGLNKGKPTPTVP